MLLCCWSSTSIIEAFLGHHPPVVDAVDVVVVVDGPSTMKDVGLTVYWPRLKAPRWWRLTGLAPG